MFMMWDWGQNIWLSMIMEIFIYQEKHTVKIGIQPIMVPLK